MPIRPVSEPGKCFVATFGCRVNQADSEDYLRILKSKNYQPTRTHTEADLVVINSCTVTHRSDTDIRKLVHRVERENPAAKVIVAGCYAQRDPEALVQLGGAHAILGNSDRHRLSEVVDQLAGCDSPTSPLVFRNEMSAMSAEELPPVQPIAVVNDRTRPFIKIQDGCDAKCTYCVIPSVRGAARSAAADDVVASVRSLVEQGYFEVVLAGIHLGTYRHGLDTLDSVVQHVLTEVPDLGRLRISCIEPMAFPMKLADIARDDPRLAPHFHLPLQSGDDAVLKRMSRPYRAEDYFAIIDGIRERIPHACLGTDVIVGFPGETDEQFETSFQILKESTLNYVHVFSYSDRPGIPSTRLRDKVDPRIIKARSRRLNDLSDVLWQKHLDAQIGETLTAITLQRDKKNPEIIAALSENYCSISLKNTELLPNTSIRVKITEKQRKSLLGQVLWQAPVAESVLRPL
jgi:threonylcarbamoyladenosine tRNA methylthiotransferase MtaB